MTTKGARHNGSMRWFWRTVIATIVACLWWKPPIVPAASGTPPPPSYYRVVGYWLPLPVSLFDLLINQSDRGIFFGLCETALISSLPLVGIATFAGLSWWFPVAGRSSETRCRKCGYILRGITEPRCPMMPRSM